MLKERSINRKWIDITLARPDRTENKNDGTTHYIKKIPENDDRVLRVVVNTKEEPRKLITVFFDRRLRRSEK